MSKTLAELIPEYLSTLVAPNTERSYSMALDHFTEFLTELGRAPDEIGIGPSLVDGVVEFVAWARDQRGTSEKMLAVLIAGVNGFFRWLSDREQVDFGPGDFMALQEKLAPVRAKPTRGQVSVLRESTLEKLLEAAELTRPGPDTDSSIQRRELTQLRNKALLQMFRSTGARTSQAVSLHRSDLEPDWQAVRVLGPGGRQLRLYFDDQAWVALQAYLAARDKALHGGAESEPLFARHNKAAAKDRIQPISANSARVAVKQVAILGGIEENISPRMVRQYAARPVFRAHRDLAFLKKALDHAELQSQEIRACLPNEDLDAIHITSKPRKPRL
jgi:integrase/recombinase XerC